MNRPPELADVAAPAAGASWTERHGTTVLVSAVVLVTLVRGLVGLNRIGLSLDETLSYHGALDTSRHLLKEIWTNPVDQFPYFLGLHNWMRLGTSETLLRIPSVFAGAGTVLFTWLIGNRLIGRGGATVAAAALGLNGFMLWYEQEARTYATTTLLVTASMWLLLRWRDNPRRSNAIVYGVIAGAAIATQPVVAAIVAVQLLVLLRFWGKGARPPASERAWALAAVAVVASPTLVELLRHGTVNNVLPRPNLAYVEGTIRNFAGYSNWCVALAGVAVAWLAFLCVRPGHGAPARADSLLLLGWALAAPVACYAVSALRPTLVDRYLLPSLPGVTLGIGVLYRSARKPSLRVAVLAALAVSVVASQVAFVNQRSEEWRALTAFVSGRQRPGDEAVIDPAYCVWATAYYFRDRAGPQVAFPADDGDYAAVTPAVRSRLETRLLSMGTTRVWWISSTANFDRDLWTALTDAGFRPTVRREYAAVATVLLQRG